ncbi:MAG: 2-C-methyl-D-erythritol 4-phosphate cytidylyltransferase [Kiritimatiellaeota bacterium]|nr:2-C-methyl-D-erythritol 4-phosphate cytidylyltransferase [Kiritimatiellota bacterium]
MTTAIIVAAGKSERMGEGVDKAFFPLGTSSKPVLAHTLRVMEQCQSIDKVVLVVRKDKVLSAQGVVQIYGCKKVSKIVPGGSSRQASVAAGLAACDFETTLVCVHDGARPCVTTDLISETIRSAKTKGSGVAAMKITDTVKSADKNNAVTETINRDALWTAQTPQTFKIGILRKALAKAAADGVKHTDDASAVEASGETVHLVPSLAPNIKITFPEDMRTAALLLGIQS